MTPNKLKLFKIVNRLNKTDYFMFFVGGTLISSSLMNANVFTLDPLLGGAGASAGLAINNYLLNNFTLQIKDKKELIEIIWHDLFINHKSVPNKKLRNTYYEQFQEYFDYSKFLEKTKQEFPEALTEIKNTYNNSYYIKKLEKKLNNKNLSSDEKQELYRLAGVLDEQYILNREAAPKP